jgi:malate synthase
MNSGADVFMADFEDSCAPTWANVIEGQLWLQQAVRRTLRFEHPDTGRVYEIGDDPAELFVRPRGWHLEERHLLVDSDPVSASLFDFGLFFFHNAKEQIARGEVPCFYLPKIEGHLEAKLWNDVFLAAQQMLGIPRGTIRATVLIETLPAAFEMDEILWQLREHSLGLNCGRWDYIFSFIKTLRADPASLLPDRSSISMERHFLRSYSRLLIQTCHRRFAHAMGGMAAQIPIKDDPVQNDLALDRVRADKAREARDGHDGTWVAHPGLVGVAREAFAFEGPHQIERSCEPVPIAADDLMVVPHGSITEGGLRQNLSVGLAYLAAWLRGVGCVPIRNLMEDAATCEISRMQLWQWRTHGARLEDGRRIDFRLLQRAFDRELGALRAQVGEPMYRTGRFELAREILESMVLTDESPEFLTAFAYRHL